jgi:uncharacterized protein DUF255
MPNQLAHEASPYLLQHANNPVDWQPWGWRVTELTTTLLETKKERKLLRRGQLAKPDLFAAPFNRRLHESPVDRLCLS